MFAIAYAARQLPTIMSITWNQTVVLLLCRGTSKLLEAALASTAENGLSNAELGQAGAAGLLPPQYVDFKEQIRTEMFTIKQKMNELRSVHGKATLTSFDDTKSSEVEIEVLTQDITRLFRKCEVRLQRFGDTSSASEADEKVRQTAHLLAGSLIHLLTDSLEHSVAHALTHLLVSSLSPSLAHSFTHSLSHWPTRSHNHLC